MDARRFLRALGDKWEGEEEVHIVVVTHGGFLHYFTEDFEGAVNDGTVGTGWSNTEFRSYIFVGKDGEVEGDRASIAETKESRERRGRGGVKVLSRGEQMKLKAAAEAEWNQKGFQNDEDEEGKM